MKKLILASACALVLAGGGAMAQTQPTPEASPGVAKHASKHASKHTTHMKHAKHMKTTGQTTGMARSQETTGQTTGMEPSKARQRPVYRPAFGLYGFPDF